MLAEIWNLGVTLRPPSLNKTWDTKDAISDGPKQHFLLHATITLPLPIKALETTQITQFGILSLPSVIFQK